MPFIWNDKTYRQRDKENTKIMIKLFIPIFIITLLLWWFYYGKEISFPHLLLVAGMTAATIFTFINLFKQYPNPKIPDTYSQWGKNLMYIGQFIISIFGLYIAVTKVIFV